MRTTRDRGMLVTATALAAVLGLASPAAAVPSSTTVTATPQSTTAGSPVHLQATVTCASDPSGGLGMTFFDGGDLLVTVPVAPNGQADYTATFPAGSHTITAAYNGNGTCDASHSTTTVEVTTAPTPPGPVPGACHDVYTNIRT
ncbi:Ig-like domain-containing protein [Streptomyces sp. NPDC006314]|uniref:Ig-like domain-containing protein n=1 Tax=Streptomyces sp. NPDC006314 TaxID=3154475 RepID=UPI0033ADF359